eukprot:gene9333-biopygen1575
MVLAAEAVATAAAATLAATRGGRGRGEPDGLETKSGGVVARHEHGVMGGWTAAIAAERGIDCAGDGDERARDRGGDGHGLWDEARNDTDREEGAGVVAGASTLLIDYQYFESP